MLYGRQEILAADASLNASANRVCDVCEFTNLRLFRLHHHNLLSRLLGCYMVKPHGQLVLVSSTPHSAYTPNLSTS